MKNHYLKPQQGMFLLEALIAVVIFCVGVLGMVALNARAIGVQSDSEYRTDAANLANEIVSTIALSVDRVNATAMKTSLDAFGHNQTGDPADCDFSGTASGETAVASWVNKVTGASGAKLALPGATTTGQQIFIGANNLVRVTVCWKGPKDLASRRYTLVSYVN